MKKLLFFLLIIGLAKLQGFSQVLTVSSNVTVAENVASGVATFTVTLAPASASTVTVNYATSNNSATTPSDYTSTIGTLTFLAGETSKTVDVPIINDFMYEGTEMFNFTISGAVSATISTATRTGTINNDDPSIATTDIIVNEATGVAAVVVTLSSPVFYNVAVDYTTFQNSTATPVSDYTTTARTLTFAPSITSMTINIPLTNDYISENPEIFRLNLSNARNTDANMPMHIDKSFSQIQITNDDPAIATTDISVSEAAGIANVVVTLATAATYNVAVDYTTFQNSTATPGSDYTTTAGTLTFAPGITSMTINIPLTNDFIWENPEYFRLNLSNARNTDASMPMQIDKMFSQILITNDDPYITTTDITVSEAAGVATVVVTLSTAVTYNIALDYTTFQNSTATPISDYTTTAGTLTFAPGITSLTINIPLTNDFISEDPEFFRLNLSNARNTDAALPMYIDKTFSQILINNDSDPVVSVSNPVVNENAGNAVFTVTLIAGLSYNFAADYSTADISATAGDDYTSTSGTITINAGTTTGTISVPILLDIPAEPAETFNLNFTNGRNLASGTVFGFGTAIGTINASRLPVTLLSFTATLKNQSTYLEWITSTEINNAHFEIERSIDFKQWQMLAKILGKNTTSERQIYTFTDEITPLGTSYYRLKQTDFDGTFTYSNVKAVSREETFFDQLTAFPNPTNNLIVISLDEPIEIENLHVIDITGSKVQSLYVRNISNNKVSIDFENQLSGMYFVKYKNRSIKILKR